VIAGCIAYPKALSEWVTSVIRRLLSEAAGSPDQTHVVESTSTLPGWLGTSNAVVASAAVRRVQAKGALCVADAARGPVATRCIAEIEATNNPQDTMEIVRFLVLIGSLASEVERLATISVGNWLEQAVRRTSP